MRVYGNTISLTKNSRGVYSLDPSLGCSSGTANNKRGCYDDCYAVRIANVYGYDFKKTVFRHFESEKHIEKIKRQIRKVKLPFIRMGTMGDPSENWNHTLYIISAIQTEKQFSLFKEKPKEVVIITKHWNNLTESQLCILSSLNVCINTSVSALDDEEQLKNSIIQYETLKPYCRSILRVVSCDFNKENDIGLKLSKVQDYLFEKYNPLDTVFRPSKNNPLIKNGVINIHKTKFLGKNSIVSKYNKKTYLGKCSTCIEMCGVNM